MNNINLAIALTTISGFSTLLGIIFIFIKFNNPNKFIASSLGFSAGVMITISIFDLLPNSLKLLNSYSFYSLIICIVSIIMGILLTMAIDYFLPENLENLNNKKLYKVGIMSLFAITLHNIPEGIATFIITSQDIKLGISFTIGILMHNIPEGISIAVPIYYATKSKMTAIFFTFISSLSELFGAILAFLLLDKFINDTVLGLLFALIVGIMLCISTCKLLPLSFKYNFKKISLLSMLIGIFFILIKLV